MKTILLRVCEIVERAVEGLNHKKLCSIYTAGGQHVPSRFTFRIPGRIIEQKNRTRLSRSLARVAGRMCSFISKPNYQDLRYTALKENSKLDKDFIPSSTIPLRWKAEKAFKISHTEQNT